ncbi:TVP38/TMEM64 family protein [Corynebacterium otitidis]
MPTTHTHGGSARIAPRGRRGRLLVAAGLAAAVLLAAFFIEVPSLGTLRAWADDVGAWFVVVFWLLYVAITQLPVPRTILTVAAGVLFGVAEGIVVVLTATTASAVVSLVLVRRVLGGWLSPRLKHPLARAIDERLRTRGWLAVGSLRMIAGVPFALMNYVAALTSVRVVPFAVATFVGSAPGSIVTVVLGDALGGRPDPLAIGLTVVIALVGFAGLALDGLLPVRNQGLTRDEREGSLGSDQA